MLPTSLIISALVLSALAVAADIPPAVDLRPQYAALGLTPKDQGPRGCCSLFAISGVLEFEWGQLCRAVGRSRPSARTAPQTSGGAQVPALQPALRLSEEYLNWASHKTNGRTVDGSFFSDALNGVEQYGVCEERLMPYAAKYDPNIQPSDAARADAHNRRLRRWTGRPARGGWTGRRTLASSPARITQEWIKPWDVKTGMTDAMLAQVRASLAAGHPVALGMRWPNEAHFVNHVLQMPPEGKVFDGHSVVLVGYEPDATQPGGGTFIFRNSSGAKWEDAGYAHLPYAYVAEYGNDAVGVRVKARRG